MIDTTINGRWSLKLPKHRAARPEWRTGWETERIGSMFDHIGTGDVVFDVGAEEGDMPGLWAQWGCLVGMFEPNARVWPNIRAIWDGNDFPKPLFAFPGFAADHDSPEFDYGINGWPECAYGPVIGDHGFCNLCERPDIQRVKIDTFARIHRPPDAITIDVEGAELRVLKGARRTLRENRPHVWVSIHPQFMDDAHGDKPEELHAFMAELGYEGRHLATDHEEHWHFDPGA